MSKDSSRRRFLRSLTLAGAGGAALGGDAGRSKNARVPGCPSEPVWPPRRYQKPHGGRSKVALIHGQDRRRMVHDALTAIDAEILQLLGEKKYVLIKPNVVSAWNPLASTHADTLRGILDYLETRWWGPIVVAESSAEDTLLGFRNHNYYTVAGERKHQDIQLVDFNQEGDYHTIHLANADIHMQRVRLAARLFDPDAFIFCSAIMKTHNCVVATLSVKNMVIGAPLRNRPGDSVEWTDKWRYHCGVRQMNYDMFLTAKELEPFWGAAVIDGFVGMEGNGPTEGTPVDSRIVIASTDFIAADRVALEAMSIDPSWLGYLTFCGQAGLGNYNLANIDVWGTDVQAVKRAYRLHDTVAQQLKWMGPLPCDIGQLP